TTAPATTITLLLSSLFSNLHQSTPIPTPTNIEATTLTPSVIESKTLNAIYLRLSELEKEVKELKNVDHSSALLSKIKSEVPNAVKEYLGTSLDDALYKVLKKHDADIIKEFPVPAEIVERLTQQYLPQQSTEKSVADKLKKTKPDDTDKDKGPSARSDRGLKRQRKSKGTETSKKTTTLKGSSKGKSPSTSLKSSKSGKSAKDQVEEPIFVQDSNYATHDDADDTSSDPEWNEGKSVDDGREQSWLNDMAKATKPPLTFDELMHTPIDFSAFAMNHLKIDNLTKEHLVGSVYNLLKGTFKTDFFFNNDLEYLRGGSNDKKYTTSTTKYKAARYELKGIEDMVPNLWCPVKHDVYSTKRILSIISVKVNEWYGYGHLEEIVVKRADQQLYTFKEVYLATSLHMFARRTVIQARVEDLQLGVESYQKKLNLTKPRTQDVDMSCRPAYTTLSNPQVVIYECNLKRKRFMRADELHKFSDGTLISVRDTLSQMLHELHLGYNKTMRRRQWTSLDQQRTRIIIKSINQKLLDRRTMRSLEKFVGEREYVVISCSTL
ncbi:hypothetical protein Tco_0534971, partial [Tanacetum coccineum]